MFSDRMQDLLAEKIEAPVEQTFTLTLEDAVAIAIALQKDERYDEAELVYSRILQNGPEHPRALHYAGVLAHQMGRSDEAVARIARSLELEPDRADWHSNFGIVYKEQGRLEEAIAAFRQAIALDPSHANAYSNLGVLLRATGQPVAAEEAYRTALGLNPEHIEAYSNLGILLNGLKRTQEAVECFCKVIILRPKHKEARKLLALAHCRLGEVDKAVKIFEEWLDEEPADPIARHMLAACTGRDVPVRASDAFVEGTFDVFSTSFEAKLALLFYRAPALVAAMLGDSVREPAKDLDVVDAGCGTGLCGPLVAPYARSLVGVDLSAGMLEHAKEKKVYDELIKAELTEFLQGHVGRFDVIVSADTLVYFGALDAVVAAAADALRPDGYLIFTVEHAVGTAEPDYRLELHGRYSHSRAYVERLLRGAGFVPEIAEAELRMESGSPVAGLVVRGTKQAKAGFNHA